jgi:hypothetical protein
MIGMRIGIEMSLGIEMRMRRLAYLKLGRGQTLAPGEDGLLNLIKGEG